MSGGGNPSQTTGPPAWAQPYAGLLLGEGSGLAIPGSSPGLPPVAQMPGNLNQQVAPFTPYQQQGLGALAGATGAATDLGGAGGNMLYNQLSGAYLDPQTNPYLQATYNEAAQGLVNQYQTATAPSQMAAGQVAAGGGPGALGGSANQQMTALNQYGLGQNLGNLATNIYGGAYEQGVQNQLGALGQLGSTQQSLYSPGQELLGAGQYQQQQQQQQLNTQYQNALAGNQYPWQQLGNFGGIFGQATGGSQTISTSGGK